MKGRTFFSCSRYPECKFATWDKPLPTPCPQCGGLMIEKRPKEGDPIAACINCNYIEDLTAVVEEG
jgi:DNA topoisomerase-1